MEYKFTYDTGKDSYKEHNFTWVLGGGISAKMTNRLNLDVGYRYYDMGKNRQRQKFITRKFTAVPVTFSRLIRFSTKAPKSFGAFCFPAHEFSSDGTTRFRNHLN